MGRPTKFEIKGLFGNLDVSIPIEGDALIIVGPNGIGKSTVVNIFYFFVSRQWSRLIEYNFDEVAIWLGKTEIRAARTDISGLSEYLKVIENIPSSSRMAIWLEKLKERNLLEEFIANRRLSQSQRERFALVLDIPQDEVRMLQASLVRRLVGSDEDIFQHPRVALEKQITTHFPNRTLYLPTYRRIEKDLREIFPEFDERLRAQMRGESLSKFGRSSTHYIDLVSFGMEDVRDNIQSKTRSLRDYSLSQYNNLSALYLRDVIRGNAEQFSTKQIATLTEETLSAILNRVSEQVLSLEDKNLLRAKITGIKGKNREIIEVNDRYLAHYFVRLMGATADISSQESEIVSFVDICNEYLFPGKIMKYDESTFSVTITDFSGNSVDLKMLSSGEKQIVSIFSHLYLDESRDQIVVIDEPELSLSVPWQKRFLSDILDSNHCSFILAVTHSPFIYQNKLEDKAVDLRRRTTQRLSG